MLHALPDHPAIKRTLDEISETLGVDIRGLDSTEALHSTISVQLALLASGVAVARALIEGSGDPEAVAGLSAGAFSAAVVAGVLSLADAVRLVRQRAELMAELYPKGYGISVIVGLNEGQVSLLVQAAHSGQTPVYLSDVNAPQQIVIAGSEEGMSKVLESARKYGATKAQRLDVAVPSHCVLLQPVADALRESLKAIRLQQPKMVYAGNVTGRALRSAESISEDLASNIAHGVRWYDATTVLEELGCRLFLEMPPGHVLSELARRAFPDVKTLAIGEVSIHEALALARRFAH